MPTDVHQELSELLHKSDLTDDDLRRGEALVAKAKADQKAGRDATLRAAVEHLAVSPVQAADPPHGAPRPKALRPGQHPWVPATLKALGYSADDPRDRAKAAVPTGTIPVRLDPEVFEWGQPAAPVADLCTQRPIAEGSSLLFWSQTSRAMAASVVPPATLKPTSALGLARREEPIVTIAHLSEPQPKQDLADLDGLSDFLASELLWGLAVELDHQIINGPGGAGQPTGVLNTPGVLTQAFAANAAETIRAAIGQLQATGYQPSAVVLNPGDAVALDVAKDLQDRYFGAGPFGAGPTTIWGLPRVVSNAMAAGTALVGAFNRVILGYRETASIDLTDSGELFTMNQILARAEIRVGIAVTVPPAFCECDLTEL